MYIYLKSMDIVVDDEHSTMRKHFAGLDKLVDIEKPAVMKSSNVDGNVYINVFFFQKDCDLYSIVFFYNCIVFLKGICYFRRTVYYHCKTIIDMFFIGRVVADKFLDVIVIFFLFHIVTDKIFVDGRFQKLTNISNETGNFEELFAGIPNLTMSSIEFAKNEDKGFNMKFGVLVGCPDKYMSHEMNKVATPNIYLVSV
ncbi:hypothetical protein Hanom_Chr04g00338741 [Helianthus anomalus]